MQEYYTVKKIVKKHCTKFNTYNAHFVNIKYNWSIINNNTIVCVKDKHSRLYYDILIRKKFQKNYMEKVWENLFGLEGLDWAGIYERNVANVRDNKIAEFKYKILTDIICPRNKISKWNPNIDEKCPFCKLKQDTLHLLYSCSRIKNMWVNVGSIIKLDIGYKTLFLVSMKKMTL